MKNPFVTFIQRYVLERADARLLNIYAAAKEGRGASRQLQREAESMQAQTLAEWKMAISSATDPENPDRTALDRLYKNLRLDNHLESVIDSRILYCQRCPFKIVDEAGNEVEDVSLLLERTWF